MSKNAIKKERRRRLTDEEAALYREEWGVPDWRNPGAYPRKDADWNLVRWKWEFLRRSSEYRCEWSAEKRYRIPIDYNLKNWIDPRRTAEPKFLRDGCYLVEFNAEDGWPQQMHYDALKMSGVEGTRIFSVDMNYALKPQLKYISEIYKAYRRHYIEKPPKKNIQRKRAELLRILDAYNEGIHIKDIFNGLYGKITMSEKAMVRTVAFAKEFWKRL